jgi:hypothetical protein
MRQKFSVVQLLGAIFGLLASIHAGLNVISGIINRYEIIGQVLEGFYYKKHHFSTSGLKWTRFDGTGILFS